MLFMIVNSKKIMRFIGFAKLKGTDFCILPGLKKVILINL